MDSMGENKRRKLVEELKKRIGGLEDATEKLEDIVDKLSKAAEQSHRNCRFIKSATRVGAATQVGGKTYSASNNFISSEDAPEVTERGGVRDHISLHAEGALLSAILKENKEEGLGYPVGSVLYCHYEPDPRDVTLAIECGIKKIVYLEKKNLSEEEQKNNGIAIDMLKKMNGVSITNPSSDEINQKIADELRSGKSVSIIADDKDEILCKTDDEYIYGLKEENITLGEEEKKENVSLNEIKKKLTVASARSALMFRVKESKFFEQGLFFIDVKSCLKCSALLYAAGIKNIVYDRSDTRGGFLKATGIPGSSKKILEEIEKAKEGAGIIEVGKSEIKGPSL